MRGFFRHEVRPSLAYAAALGCTGLAWLLIHQFIPGAASPVAFLVCLVAVVGTGVLGGRGPTLLATAASLVAVDYFFIPTAGALKLPYTLIDGIAFAAFIAAGALIAWTTGIANQALLQRRHEDAISKRLEVETRQRESLVALATRALAGRSVEAICRDAASTTASALGVEHCAVLELSREGGPLVMVAVAGWDAAVFEGLTLDTDVDAQTGYALYARDAVVVSDADAERRFSLPSILRGHGVRSGVAARIAGASQTFGVLSAYSTEPREYSPGDAQFVSAVATILAGMYERRRLDSDRAALMSRDQANRTAAERASKRARFLAQTATIFDAVLEPEATLVSLARLAVPDLAECAIVDLVHEDGYVRRVEVVDIDPIRRDVALSVRRQAPNMRTDSAFSRAIRTGQPNVLSAIPDPQAESVTEHERLMKTLECQSLLLVPLVARGQTLGLLTLASREPSRRYDAADLALAQELAGRAAVALDNSRLYREAQAASRAKDDFLAMVSHELRTPINAVLGWATMLREHRLDESRAEYACDAIERSARAQAQLLEQLLDVSRAVSGKLELHLAPANLAGVVEAALDAVRPDAADKNVRLASRLDRSIPLVMVDPERLQQVVINILTNAVKFSPEDGLVQLQLLRSDEFAEIVVQDHGVGIKREFLPYVFERFRQAPDQGAVNRGLGLGMSIARDIIERHGGTIVAESDGEGKGATFTVRLPLRPSSETALIAVRPGGAGDRA